jgi:hypothetical protein
MATDSGDPRTRYQSIAETNDSEPDLAGRAAVEFRLSVALGFVGAAFTLGVIVIADHSIGRWLWAALSIGVLATGIFRFRKEKALLTEWATAVATVTAWERTEGNEGGYYYSVRYRFIGPDNRAYVGKSGSTAEELPREGEMLPISYKRSDPTDSLPLMTFWFYGFTYTGFARWI